MRMLLILMIILKMRIYPSDNERKTARNPLSLDMGSVKDTKGDTSIDIPGLEKEIKILLKSLFVVEVSHVEESEFFNGKNEQRKG